MKVSRYFIDPNNPDTSSLVCYFYITNVEYETLGAPNLVTITVKNGVICISKTNQKATNSYAVGRYQYHKDPNQYRIRVLAPIFTGTKVFGVEELIDLALDEETGSIQANSIFTELPKMDKPIRFHTSTTRKSKNHAQKISLKDVENIDTGVIVRELNNRRHADKRLTFALTDEGNLAASITYE